jgi:hypothetical protein
LGVRGCWWVGKEVAIERGQKREAAGDDSNRVLRQREDGDVGEENGVVEVVGFWDLIGEADDGEDYSPR